MIVFSESELSEEEQAIVDAGFASHSKTSNAPEFRKKKCKWVACDERKQLIGVLTAELLWDWLYIDELWVKETHRGSGLGQGLVNHAETFARGNKLSGLWLWTQSWQAVGFYERLDFEEFARFPDFPTGYERVGFRKLLRSTE